MSSVEATTYFAKWVLYGEQVIENGAVRIVGDTIDQVGFHTGIRQSGDRIVNLGNRMLLPGLINLHTTLEEAPLRGTVDPLKSHTNFILTKEMNVATHLHQETITAINLTINESLINGITTTVSNMRRLCVDDYAPFSGRQILIKHIKRDDAHTRYELASTIDSQIRKGAVQGVTPDRLFTISPQWLKEVQRSLLGNSGHFMMHLGENPDELQAFSECSGPLYDTLLREDRWFYKKSDRGAIWYAISNNLIPRGSTIINPCNSGVDELDAMNSLKTTIAISPRYTDFFGLRKFPLELLEARKLSLAVVTETPAVARSMNLLDELFVLRQRSKSISAIELIKMVTYNPAKALKLEHRRGILSKGYDADMIALDISSFSQDPLEEVISGNGKVAFVMVRGEEIIVPA